MDFYVQNKIDFLKTMSTIFVVVIYFSHTQLINSRSIIICMSCYIGALDQLCTERNVSCR